MPKYLIIGGGMTADSALQAIRENDKSGEVTMIGAEMHPPYNRPPLSKGLWKGDAEETIWRKPAEPDVELVLGRRVTALDLKKKSAVDDQGTNYTFEKLLIATGGIVNTLPFGGDDIIYYRTFDDYQRLRALAADKERFAVIGGGFIGWEVAAALAMNGRKVTLLFPQEGLGQRIFPHDLSQFLNSFYRDKGAEVAAGETVAGVERRGGGFVLNTAGGRSIEVDAIVAGIGIRPNVEPARAAGLQINNGIVVNERLQTRHADVYAAGDVAEFFNPALGKRMRVEHEDAANSMGRAAGESMAGRPTAYHYLPFFYSDLFDLGFEAVGDLDSRLQTFADWKTPFREGVVYYLEHGRVRGVLLWNTWGQVDYARSLIEEAGPFQPSDLKGRLPVS
ncbi:MAG: NAD(P)/FAD-dependent oxidoreductase [Terriglobia bacterium]